MKDQQTLTDGVQRRALGAAESGGHGTGEAAEVGSLGQAPRGGPLCPDRGSRVELQLENGQEPRHSVM